MGPIASQVFVMTLENILTGERNRMPLHPHMLIYGMEFGDKEQTEGEKAYQDFIKDSLDDYDDDDDDYDDEDESKY